MDAGIWGDLKASTGATLGLIINRGPNLGYNYMLEVITRTYSLELGPECGSGQDQAPGQACARVRAG